MSQGRDWVTPQTPHLTPRKSPLCRYAKVEKIPGGDIEDSRVLKGVMFNKDVVHGKMRRRIEKPRILLLDCTLEYKKGESQTNIEVTRRPQHLLLLHHRLLLRLHHHPRLTPRPSPPQLTDDKAWEELLRQEEDHIQAVCDEIIAVKPDLVITEKGVSDLAQVQAPL